MVNFVYTVCLIIPTSTVCPVRLTVFDFIFLIDLVFGEA
jgi:hypothetical protein